MKKKKRAKRAPKKKKDVDSKIKKVDKSNINDEKLKIKVNTKEKVAIINKRIPTGIKGFDKLIEGGFENKSANLIVGASGSGKTIFSVQFLLEGIRKGESTLYITFEEKKQEFFNNMSRFGWDFYNFEKKGKFTFLEYSPEKVRVMLEEGGGSIESIVLKNKIKRIVIDSVTSFALLFDNEGEKREAALALFNMIRKWGVTSLLTLEEDPSSRSAGPSKALEFEADGIVLVYFIRKRGKRTRYIEVLKMRGTNHSKDIYSFSIKNEGISIDKKSWF